MSVDKVGFKKFVHNGISLLSADKLAVDVVLTLGTQTESISVNADAGVLQTETATRQAVIENRVLENVPSGAAICSRCNTTSPAS